MTNRSTDQSTQSTDIIYRTLELVYNEGGKVTLSYIHSKLFSKIYRDKTGTRKFLKKLEKLGYVAYRKGGIIELTEYGLNYLLKLRDKDRSTDQSTALTGISISQSTDGQRSQRLEKEDNSHYLKLENVKIIIRPITSFRLDLIQKKSYNSKDHKGFTAYFIKYDQLKDVTIEINVSKRLNYATIKLHLPNLVGNISQKTFLKFKTYLKSRVKASLLLLLKDGLIELPKVYDTKIKGIEVIEDSVDWKTVEEMVQTFKQEIEVGIEELKQYLGNKKFKIVYKENAKGLFDEEMDQNKVLWKDDSFKPEIGTNSIDKGQAIIQLFDKAESIIENVRKINDIEKLQELLVNGQLDLQKKIDLIATLELIDYLKGLKNKGGELNKIINEMKEIKNDYTMQHISHMNVIKALGDVMKEEIRVTFEEFRKQLKEERKVIYLLLAISIINTIITIIVVLLK